MPMSVSKMSGLLEHVERERSVKKEDTLSRSTTKYKDHHVFAAVDELNKGKLLDLPLVVIRDRKSVV